MFKKILIANRGEIAVRVVRACRDLGIQSAVVYSDADRTSLPVILSDESYYIGASPSKQSYLNVPKLISAIKACGADAVHPGYGFLSENAGFAKEIEKLGVRFIGPSPASIELMGDKLRAREKMKSAGIPIVPGSEGAIHSLDQVQDVINKIGYPIIIKASAGGGGKGMRIVRKPEELENAYRSAKSEALNYFNNDTIYIERFIGNPKHIEIQIFGDMHGNVIHLFERECSVQRRHQKLIEESPSPSVPESVRLRMGEIAVQAAKSINYVGAGTFEFIFDAVTKDFYFMEMNTRLQVEHPVTELVTGVDLVQEQIKVAWGEKLSVQQKDVKQNYHAIECRICAEDPQTFLPSPGKILRCRQPQGAFVRVDSYAVAGFEIPIDYDPMIGKLIVWGKNRDECIKRLKRALKEYSVTGVKTNIPLHKIILEHPKFLDGSYTTQFIEKELDLSEKNLFKSIDDRVFLITAAIEGYRNAKSKDTSKLKTSNQWRDYHRNLRGS